MYKYNCNGYIENNKKKQTIEHMTDKPPIFFQSIIDLGNELKNGTWPNKLKISGDNSQIIFGNNNEDTKISNDNKSLNIINNNKNESINLQAKGKNGSINLQTTKGVNVDSNIYINNNSQIIFGNDETNTINPRTESNGKWIEIRNQKGHIHLDARDGNLYISAKKILGSDRKPLIISKDIRFHQLKHFEIPGIDANEYPIAVLSSFWSNSTPNTYSDRFEIKISKEGNKWITYCNTNTNNRKADNIEARYTFFHKSLCEDNPSNGPLHKH